MHYPVRMAKLFGPVRHHDDGHGEVDSHGVNVDESEEGEKRHYIPLGEARQTVPPP